MGIDRCRPKGECPQPAWVGRWSTPTDVKVESRRCGPLIDDLEDNTGIICLDDGRVGAWYTFNDGLGRQFPDSTPGTPIQPSPDPDNGSHYAMHTYYNHDERVDPESAQDFHAGVGVDLKFNGKQYGHYDGSRYQGVSFRARGSLTNVSVRVNTVDTTYVDFAGTCEYDCRGWTWAMELTDAWKHYDVPFTELVSDECPIAPCPIDTARLTNVQFQFVNDYTQHEVHLWIDDVAFF